MNSSELEKAKKAQREYAREWRAKNPERAREINLRYWARRADRKAAEAEGREVQNERNED